MEKDLKATEVKDEALKQSFAEIKKAANSEQPAAKKTGTKAEVKTEAKTAVKAAAEKKPVEKKTVEKKPVEKKPVEKKAETKPAAKKAAEKKAVEKKPVEKKPVEKKPVEKKPVEKKAEPKAEVSTFVTLQINNQDYDPAKLQEEAIAAARKIKADVASVDVYINVAESAAYYTIDGEGSSDYRIDL